MATLQLHNIRKKFGEIKALEQVNLTMNEKCFLVLAGPSGCGKTTLLQIIAGFIQADEGSVFLDGVALADKEPSERNIAMVFQDAALFPHLKVFDNIAFGLEYSGLTKDESKSRVEEAAKMLHIEDLLERKASTLSTGQKQRVSIARAFVRKPKLFLMDEALSALDARLKTQLRIEIAQLYKNNDATFLYVTHDQVEAMTLADILIIMNEGIFQQVGKPMDIYKYPKNLFVASFLGKYEINKFKGHIDNQVLYWKEKRLKLTNAIDNQEVVLGVREEHIRVDEEFGTQGIIVLIENVGDEVYVHIKSEEQVFIMKKEKSQTYHLGDAISFGFMWKDVLVFNAQTTNRIEL
ncbi:MAG: ABC transporter ATP-binding protein [Longicatena sp.]